MIGQVKIMGTWAWKNLSDDALKLGRSWVRRGKPKHAPADPPSMSTSQIKKMIANAKKPRTRPPGSSAKPSTAKEDAVSTAKAYTAPTHRPKGTPGGSATVKGEKKGEYVRDLEKRLIDAENTAAGFKSGGKVKKLKDGTGSGGVKKSGGRAKSNADKKNFPGMTAQEIRDAQRLGETGLADPHKGKILKRARKSSPEEITKMGKRYAGVGAQVRETSDKFAKLQAKVRKAGGGKDVSKADIAQFKKWMKKYGKNVTKDVGLIGDYGSKAAKAKSFKRRAKMPNIRSKKRYAYGGRVAKYKG